MGDYKRIEDIDRAKWMIDQVFTVATPNGLDTKDTLKVLKAFADESGKNICGDEQFSCIHSAYYGLDEEYYMGEHKVKVVYDYVSGGGEELIMDEREFYPYIEKYTLEFVHQYPAKKDEALNYLRKIQQRFEITS